MKIHMVWFSVQFIRPRLMILVKSGFTGSLAVGGVIGSLQYKFVRMTQLLFSPRLKVKATTPQNN